MIKKAWFKGENSRRGKSVRVMTKILERSLLLLVLLYTVVILTLK